jgi:hypothetical protein
MDEMTAAQRLWTDSRARDAIAKLEAELAESREREQRLEKALFDIQGESYLAMLNAPDEVPDPLTACKNINRLARAALARETSDG